MGGYISGDSNFAAAELEQPGSGLQQGYCGCETSFSSVQVHRLFLCRNKHRYTLMPNLIRQNGEENVHGKSIANFKYLHLEIHKYLHFLPSCQTAFNLKFCKAIKKQIKKLRLQ